MCLKHINCSYNNRGIKNVIFGNKKKGFTLIEMFITLSVIAVVFAVSFYFYNDYVEDARISVRRTNEKLVNEAIERYYKEHMNYPKYLWKDDSIEEIDKKIYKGLDSAFSGYFVNKNVSDIFLESTADSSSVVYFLVTEPLRKDISDNIDNKSEEGIWKLAKNIKNEAKDYLVHKIKIAEPES